MKLSVIVPAYNVAAYIHECLLSILAQKVNFDFEVIVCDDASTDKTFDAINYLTPTWTNLVVLKNDLNLGLIGAMRKLLHEAKGDYIAYLDGDDIALPGKLQEQVDYLDENRNCSMVYHESDMFDSNTGSTIKYYSKDYYNAKYIPQKSNIIHLIRYGVFLQASSIMFRRHDHLVQALEHGCKIICDYPWHIMNTGYLGGTIDRLENVLGRYRVHASSFGAQTQQNYQRRLTVTEELVNACRMGERFDIDRTVIQAGINHVYFSAALYFLQRDQDALFKQLIENSAEEIVWFDDRHQYSYQHRNTPEFVRKMLGWS